MKTTQLRIELCLAARWDEIEPTRRAVVACAEVAMGDDAAAYALAMAAAELLENAVKYGAPGAKELSLEVVAGPQEARVCVRNTVEGPEVVGVLERRIRWIESFPSAKDAYLQALEQSRVALEQTGDRARRGGLGLVRVACEAECKLRVWADSATQIAVEASRQAKI